MSAGCCPTSALGKLDPGDYQPKVSWILGTISPRCIELGSGRIRSFCRIMPFKTEAEDLTKELSVSAYSSFYLFEPWRESSRFHFFRNVDPQYLYANSAPYSGIFLYADPDLPHHIYFDKLKFLSKMLLIFFWNFFYCYFIFNNWGYIYKMSYFCGFFQS